MTTQAVNAAISSRSNGWTFGATATDGQWNTLTDTLSGSQLGILIPNVTVDNLMTNYAGGLAAVRIQDAITLAVKYRGFASAAGYNWYPASGIGPIRISANDQLQVYSQPVDATANQSNVLAWVTTNTGMELYQGLDVVDSTDTEITSAINGASLGASMFQTTLTSIKVQCEDGASLSNVTLVDDAGGVVMTLYGNQRGVTAGQQSLILNGDFMGLNVKVGRGWKLRVKTVSA